MEQDPNRIRPGLGQPYSPEPKSYALTGKIMLSAIVVLFIAVLLILLVHVYVRCCLFRRRRRNHRRRVRRFHHPHSTSSAPCGLDASVLRSLPVFVFSARTHQGTPECAVCLSEFEENEKGRLLPKCNHSFHIDCIDMWFQSHSTCPLCRAPVRPDSAPPNPPPDVENPVEIAVGVVEEGDSHVGSSSSGACLEETGTSSSAGSGSCSSSSGSSGVCSSSSFRMKALGFVGLGIEVPTRRSLEDMEIAVVSPGGQGLKSPGSRILSLKRILSRDRRAGIFSTSPSPIPSPSPVAETDLERGEESGNQTQTHNQTQTQTQTRT